MDWKRFEAHILVSLMDRKPLGLISDTTHTTFTDDVLFDSFVGQEIGGN